MNERIKELADQALKECDTAKERGIAEYSKRLAELIVKECADKILFEKARTPGQSDYMRGYRDMADNAVFVIKKHFGVEE